MAVFCMLSEQDSVIHTVTLPAPPAGLNFQTALIRIAPQSSSTISSLLLVAMTIHILSLTNCSASLGRAVIGDGLRNSHPCQQNDGDQQHCALEQL